ncbi:MAG: hypothetical protein H0U59_06065 [Gemmatimonadaceae bacterium]|nr:hypothetical protein [Gemmatimonadaceae bacterium]
MPTVTAPTPISYSPVVDAVTYQQFLRGEWEQTKKLRILTEMLEKNGNIKFDEAGGSFIQWNARVGEYAADYRADLASRQFSRKQLRVAYTAPWGFLDMTGVLSDRDLQINRGPSAIKQLSKTMLTEMGEDFRKKINREILRTNASAATTFGQATFAGTTAPIYGLPSIFGTPSTVKNWNPATQTTTQTIAAADREAMPNATYCGVSTNPSTTPAGVDNFLAEATSPVLANWSSTAWPGGAATLVANIVAVASRLNLRLMRSADADEQADMGLCDKIVYETFKQALRAGTTQMVVLEDKPTEPDVGLVKRRFLPFEGVNVFMDDDAPANVLYWLNSKKLEFRLLPQAAAEVSGTGAIKGDATEMFSVTQQHSIEQGGHLVAATFAGQLIGNPRFQGAAFNYA